MMGAPVFEHVDDAFEWALTTCLSEGFEIAPRGIRTRELLGVSFALSNPRGRVTTWARRSWSMALAVGELAWHFRGSDNVEELTHYAPSWIKYTDDGSRVMGSCYGRKIFAGGDESQWSVAKSILKFDPASRRAIISTDILSKSDATTRDKSCLSTMHFLIRNGKLDVFVNMRSNDIYLGLPYDVFLFSMFQERMAVELGVELGTYHHIAASLHVYETDIEKLRRKGGLGQKKSDFMDKMPEGNWFDDFAKCESALRMGSGTVKPDLPVYWKTLLQYVSF
jgi:thymidylate synthase